MLKPHSTEVNDYDQTISVIGHVMSCFHSNTWGKILTSGTKELHAIKLFSAFCAWLSKKDKVLSWCDLIRKFNTFYSQSGIFQDENNRCFITQLQRDGMDPIPQ